MYPGGFESVVERRKLRKIIYLSPDAEVPLQGALDRDAIYIVGGLVDETVEKVSKQLMDRCAYLLPRRIFCQKLPHVVDAFPRRQRFPSKSNALLALTPHDGQKNRVSLVFRPKTLQATSSFEHLSLRVRTRFTGEDSGESHVQISSGTP